MKQLICNGEITQAVDSFPVCSTGWVAQLASLPFDLSQIDPVIATQLFGGGFFLTVPVWAVSWGFGQLLKSIDFRGS